MVTVQHKRENAVDHISGVSDVSILRKFVWAHPCESLSVCGPRFVSVCVCVCVRVIVKDKRGRYRVIALHVALLLQT